MRPVTLEDQAYQALSAVGQYCRLKLGVKTGKNVLQSILNNVDEAAQKVSNVSLHDELSTLRETFLTNPLADGYKLLCEICEKYEIKLEVV